MPGNGGTNGWYEKEREGDSGEMVKRERTLMHGGREGGGEKNGVKGDGDNHGHEPSVLYGVGP